MACCTLSCGESRGRARKARLMAGAELRGFRFRAVKTKVSGARDPGGANRRRVSFLLAYFDQAFTCKLQYGEKGDDEDRHALLRLEQIAELDELRFLEIAQHAAHMRAYRELLARYRVVLVYSGAVEQRQPCDFQVVRMHLRQLLGSIALE